MLLYKYVTPDRIDVLENGRIRFTQANSLNDPFEIRPCFDKRIAHLEKMSQDFLSRQSPDVRFEEIETEVRDTIDKEIQKLQEYLVKDFLVLSLTRKRNNLAMWSHYTDSYRGFVIGFDSDNSFFHPEKPRDTMPVLEVGYSNKRPIFPETNEDISEAASEMLLTKSEHWSYEEEYRMFAKSEAAAQVVKDIDGNDIYLFDFPPKSVSEIIFGYQMPNRQKETIASIVKLQYANARLFETRISSTEFDLDIERYS